VYNPLGLFFSKKLRKHLKQDGYTSPILSPTCSIPQNNVYPLSVYFFYSRKVIKKSRYVIVKKGLASVRDLMQTLITIEFPTITSKIKRISRSIRTSNVVFPTVPSPTTPHLIALVMVPLKREKRRDVN